MSAEMMVDFLEIQDRRERADYEYHPVSADVDALLDRTEEFVENMADLLDDVEVNTTDADP